jgi:vacuolar-type H+-ATPase subunit H
MPPLYDVARANIAHYQTTANVMESGYVGTQPLVHVDVGETDLDEWAQHNPGPVTLGNRSGLITKGGRLEIVQAQATDYNMGIMERLESQMVMLGARLVQSGRQVETAEAARINASAEASVLDVVVGNASECIEAALEDMARFMGQNPDAVNYTLNDTFWETQLSPQDLQAVIQARQFGLIGNIDALDMIRSGSIKLSDQRTNDDILADAAELNDDNLPDDE